MIRDLSKIKRDLENKENNDVICKKNLIKNMLYEDPDVLEVLGNKDKQPYLSGMTDEEKKAVDEYNEKISHDRIVPWLKLNGIQKEVLNFIMFDIDDTDVSYTNNVIKNQYLLVMCLVHEDDMETEYEIPRTDLLDYLVRDLLLGSNVLGPHLKLISDCNGIIDSKYYCRTMKFKMQALNLSYGTYGSNQYDGISP